MDNRSSEREQQEIKKGENGEENSEMIED